MANRRTALYSIQAAHGGRMVDFHGWDMPVQFTSILDEHRAVRDGSGIFDLGHMGRLAIGGTDALTFLEQRICRRLETMKPGQVRYGLVLNEAGGTEDDVLVSREDDNAFHVVVNASNLKKIKGLWSPPKNADLKIVDLSDDQAMLAVQGPATTSILAGLGLLTADQGYYHFIDLEWEGMPLRLSRTGYTGEDGFECFLPALRAEKLWQALVDAGVTPCGLGSRDLLRLEAGMPLYGHELDESHSPLEAGLEFAVSFRKDYIGKAVLEAQQEAGLTRRLVGLRIAGKRAPRPGYAILADGAAVGVVTSGSWSPTLDCSIAMAYVTVDHVMPGSILAVDLRGKTTLPAEVVDLPFYQRKR